MFAGLATGMATGLGRLTGVTAVMVNLVLLVQFPLLHSFLLTPRGRHWLARTVPQRYARELVPTAYTTITALQLGLLFLGWSPSGLTIFEFPTSVQCAFAVAFLGAWVLLLRSMWDAGLSLQTGSLGWCALYRGVAPKYPRLPTQGLFRVCRQPIYLSFTLITWLGPAWSADKVMVASILTAYCVLAPLLKEQRFSKLYGAEFAAYRAQVPYLVPRLSMLRVRDGVTPGSPRR
ncbi:MAG: isoprenylcysteine carboxylmethyltransferase family protein [Planctomycetota bacterium]